MTPPKARIFERVSPGVTRVLAASLLLVALTGCASQESDYTPQIHVVPGAAARSLWIGTKASAKDASSATDDDAEPGEERDLDPLADASEALDGGEGDPPPR